MAPDERVGVGVARWAVAETGSLVFHSGEDTPILFNFLPLHHIVLVRASTVLAYLEDYSNAFATTGERQPRNVNIITGASGTTDIEGILVRGAHGPRNLHIVIAK
jgi:L-lactate dehydrogenase complex protein LldG